MKLRNKTTGEIGTPRVDYQEFYVDTENGHTYNYKSLQRMYEEWEDVPEGESKECWVVNPYGDVVEINTETGHFRCYGRPAFSFETREEADRAVEKLKAWNRLGLVGCSYRIIDPLKLESLEQIKEDEMVVPSELEVEVHFKVKPNCIISSKDLDTLFNQEDN